MAGRTQPRHLSTIQRHAAKVSSSNTKLAHENYLGFLKVSKSVWRAGRQSYSELPLETSNISQKRRQPSDQRTSRAHVSSSFTCVHRKPRECLRSEHRAGEVTSLTTGHSRGSFGPSQWPRLGLSYQEKQRAWPLSLPYCF